MIYKLGTNIKFPKKSPKKSPKKASKEASKKASKVSPQKFRIEYLRNGYTNQQPKLSFDSNNNYDFDHNLYILKNDLSNICDKLENEKPKANSEFEEYKQLAVVKNLLDALKNYRKTALIEKIEVFMTELSNLAGQIDEEKRKSTDNIFDYDGLNKIIIAVCGKLYKLKYCKNSVSKSRKTILINESPIVNDKVNVYSTPMKSC
jgi:hypothetical protein